MFTTAGMNETSPDTIKGTRWVGPLYVEEEEPGRRRRTRVRGDAAGLGRRPVGGDNDMQRVHYCGNGAPASKSGEKNLETGPTVGRKGTGVRKW